MPPLYDDHILDRPFTGYNVREEVEAVFYPPNGRHALGHIDYLDLDDLPSYTAIHASHLRQELPLLPPSYEALANGSV